MIIQPHPVDVEQSEMLEATAHLADFFDSLVWTYGGLDMDGWCLVFTVPALVSFGGQCDPQNRVVYINTVALGRDIQSKRGLEHWRGLVIHEFAHAWGFENYRSGFLHTFPFHCAVSLLLAKFDLDWDKRLYNLCDDQKGRYHYTPAVLFRMCRLLARRIHNKDTLKIGLERLLAHFDTRPKTLGQVRRWTRFEIKQWQMAYGDAIAETKKSLGYARMWERACWGTVGVSFLVMMGIGLVI